MKGETEMEESAGSKASTETAATGDSNTPEGQSGPTWRGWVLSILVAILLSVTATLLLGGSGAFRSDRANGAGADRSGTETGHGCCPPAGAGK
jgi:hypothetical protein